MIGSGVLVLIGVALLALALAKQAVEQSPMSVHRHILLETADLDTSLKK